MRGRLTYQIGGVNPPAAEFCNNAVQIYKEEFGFDSDDICKTPWVAQQICGKLVEGGVELARFQRIIDSVDAL
jgi:hypothetical protein